MPAETPTKPTTTIAEKPATQDFDPFHPAMPQIPGVNSPPPRRPWALKGQDPKRIAQIAGIAAAVLLVGVSILWLIESIPRSHNASAADADLAVSSPPVPAPALPPAPSMDGPTTAASLEELSKPWSAKTFTFATPLTHESVDAMVVRLPGGALWAFSLQEPYGRCALEFVTDVRRLATQFKYRAVHPMVVNLCDSTVYDPLKVGSLGGNVWIRGEIVQGPGLRPPISINVQVKGRSIVADRIE